MSSLKSNRNVKYLLPMVLVIWGLFFFRLFDACSPDAPISKETSPVAKFNPPRSVPRESFELLPVERDPFMDREYRRPDISNISPGPKAEKAPWPNLQYLGTVSDGDSGKRIFILNINGTQQLMSKGETLEGVTLLSGNTEKVTLGFKGERKELSKE